MWLVVKAARRPANFSVGKSTRPEALLSPRFSTTKRRASTFRRKSTANRSSKSARRVFSVSGGDENSVPGGLANGEKRSGLPSRSTLALIGRRRDGRTKKKGDFPLKKKRRFLNFSRKIGTRRLYNIKKRRFRRFGFRRRGAVERRRLAVSRID